MAAGESQNHPLKVCVFIPNEGHTLPESYDNRLAGHVHLGLIEGVSKALEAVRAADLSDEQREKIEQRLGELLVGNEVISTHYLAKTKRPVEFYVGTAGRMHAHIARECLADKALEMGADYLFMIDDDMICPTSMFEQLFAHDVDIIAPLAFMRKHPHSPVIYTVRDGYDPISQSSYFTNLAVKSYPKDQLVECDAVGFGAVLIKMDVFKKLPKPWFATWSRIGEDIGFCHAAKRYGFRVFMDTSVKLGHLGDPVCVTEETYEKANDNEKVREVFPQTNLARLRAVK